MNPEQLQERGITQEEYDALDPARADELTEDEFWSLAVSFFDGEER